MSLYCDNAHIVLFFIYLFYLYLNVLTFTDLHYHEYGTLTQKYQLQTNIEILLLVPFVI